MFYDIDDSVIKKIKNVIEQRDNCSLSMDKSFQTYWIHTPDNYSKTEFRIARLINTSLTVSRVCFQNRRVGTMTEIFQILKQYCEQEGIKTIIIQSVETKEMENWCVKNGFKPYQGNVFVDDVLIGDYAYMVD